jgi:hypothetical protein
MTDLKAIETRFDGHRFRSRLEARWAVFFKEMKFRYEYELEGYQLPGGGAYLPDFFLPDFNVHVEVKPTPNLTREALRKIVLFAVDGDKPLLLIVGTPTTQKMYLIDRTSSGGWDEVDGYDEADVVEMFFDNIGDWAEVEFGGLPMHSGWYLVFKSPVPYVAATFGSALVKAKQARFEHGESG